MSQLVYVYAIAAPRPDITLSGIGGHAVRWIQEGDVQAAVSDVPEDEFRFVVPEGVDVVTAPSGGA